MATFADRIKTLRQNKGWTQARMAEKLGISTSTLSRYETGKAIPKRSEIERYAEILNRNPDWLACVPGATKKRVQSVTDSVPDATEDLPDFEIPVPDVSTIVPAPEPSRSCAPLEVVPASSATPSPAETPLPERRKSLSDIINEFGAARSAVIAALIILAIIFQISSSIRNSIVRDERNLLRETSDQYAAQLEEYTEDVSHYEEEIAGLQAALDSANSRNAYFEDQLPEKYDSGYEAGSSDGYDSGYSDGYEAGLADGRAAAESEAVAVTDDQLKDQYNAGYAAGQSDGYESGHAAGYDEGYSAGDWAGYSRGLDESAASASSRSSTSDTGSWENTSGNYAPSATGYPSTTTVYVSNSGKIHLHSTCSGMKSYRTMTLGEAESKGYDLCKNCF